MVQLTATPQSALVDEPVHIRVRGLSPFQVVCLQASMRDEKQNWFYSEAYYKANEVGEVDLERDAALGGDYVGVHPMGLFWSMKPETLLTRLMKRDVMNTPFQVQLKLCHPCFPLRYELTSAPMASLTLERWYVAPGVTRLQVKEGRLRGALFLPPGEGPFPGVIDLFGGTGGLIEFRASLLASHGFASLALAYWAYEDLPAQLEKVDLDYFEDAANFLLGHPKVAQTLVQIISNISHQGEWIDISTTFWTYTLGHQLSMAVSGIKSTCQHPKLEGMVLGPGLGVVSVCKGAEIGLSMAIHLKQITATVLINGCNFAINVPQVYRGQIFQPASCSIEYKSSTPLGFAEFYQVYEENGVGICQFFFPIEKAQGHFLFIVGEDDKNINSKVHAAHAIEQLKRNGKNNWKLLSYPGAGHLIEPPYSPLCRASRTPSVVPAIHWGGEVIPHAAAQEHAWKEIQKFLRKHLIPVVTSQL